MEQTESVQDPVKLHQIMMDKAYEIWSIPANAKMSYEDFLECVKEDLGIDFYHAVITGNMNYQVENGGWYQWDDNGYSVSMEELVEFFQQEEFKEYSEISKLVRILRDVEEQLDWKHRGLNEIKQVDYDFQDTFKNALDDEFDRTIGYLDTDYYGIHERILEILDNYFCQKKIGGTEGETKK
jgi:hypothetical protein